MYLLEFLIQILLSSFPHFDEDHGREFFSRLKRYKHPRKEG